MTDETTDSETDSLQSIPNEQQEISTEEIIEADYEVVPSSLVEPNETNPTEDQRMQWGRHQPPGQTRHDDSIEASSEDPDQTEDGHSYSAGYKSSMATRIGDEKKDDPEAERLRELHEGRHPSDGDHSIRESQRDKRRISQAICSELPLARHEREKVVHIVENIDLSQFGHHKGISRVTLGVVAVLIDEHIRDPDPESDPDDGGAVRWSETYRDMCDSLDVSMSDLESIKRTVREAFEEGDLRIAIRKSSPRRDPALPGKTQKSELPSEYWEAKSPEYWISVAKKWASRTDEWKEGFPEEYRELVHNLRKWEPWKDEEDDYEGSEPFEQPTDESQERSSRAAVSIDDEEVEKAMEEAIDELEDEISD